MTTRKIVTIGGSGQKPVLRALRRLRRRLQKTKTSTWLIDLLIIAMVGVTDSGGSTGRLRKEYGCAGHIGDMMECIQALSRNRILAKLCMHRFRGGFLDHQALKNLILLAFAQIAEAEGVSIHRAYRNLYRLFEIEPHKVIPVADSGGTLCAWTRRGILDGEHLIDTLGTKSDYDLLDDFIWKLFIEHPVKMSHQAAIVLDELTPDDSIIFCPGDFKSTLIPILLVEGVAEAIASSRAKIVFFINLMTKVGETSFWDAREFVEQLQEAIHGRLIDVVVYDTTRLPTAPRVRGSSVELTSRKVPLGRLRSTPRQRVLRVELAKSTPDGFRHSSEAIESILPEVLGVNELPSAFQGEEVVWGETA